MISYSQIMEFHNKLPFIWKYPTVPHERIILTDKINPDDRVLDIGCGSGWVYTDMLLPNGFSGEYVGYDNDESLSPVGFKFYSNFEVLAAKEKQFDVLIAFNILEHLPFEQAIKWLEEINRDLLKPNARILIMTPNVFCLDYLFKDPQHKTFWPYDALHGLLNALGFKDIEIWRTKGYAPIRGDPKMDERQRMFCEAMFLDWYGNIIGFGEKK